MFARDKEEPTSIYSPDSKRTIITVLTSFSKISPVAFRGMFGKMDESEKEGEGKNVGSIGARRWLEGLDRALERKPAYELADNR